MTTLNFENLPNAVAELQAVQNQILALLLQKANNNPESENPLGIKEVCNLIGKTAPTIYGYCQRNEIPYHKNGNRLIFFKSEIIDWIKQGKQKTVSEIEAETDMYLSNKKK